MNDMRKIIAVKPTENFSVICTMENGEIIEYDMSWIKEAPGPMPAPLREPYFFSLVGLDPYGNLSWPNGYDIAADTVSLDGELIQKSA